MSKKRKARSGKPARGPFHFARPSIVILAMFASLIGWLLHSWHRSSAASSATETAPRRPEIRFGPTIANPGLVPSALPEGMMWIPGGEFSMGAQNAPDNDGMKATQDSRPVHRVYVDGFFMDNTDVTNRQVEKLVNATHYVTVAKRKPRAEDLPGAPHETLQHDSVLFS